MCVTPGAAAASGAPSTDDGARPESGECRRPPAFSASDVHDRACVHEILDDDRDRGCATGRAGTELLGGTRSAAVDGSVAAPDRPGPTAEQEPRMKPPPAAPLERLDALAERRDVPEQTLVLVDEIELVHAGTIRPEVLT